MIPTEDVNRVIAAVQALPDVLSQYSYLADVRNSKGGVFFAALELHPELLLPVVYTPGIGDACLNWGRLSAKPRALVLSYEDRGNVAKKMKDFKSDASVVVVTDGKPACFYSTQHASLCVCVCFAFFSTSSLLRNVDSLQAMR